MAPFHFSFPCHYNERGAPTDHILPRPLWCFDAVASSGGCPRFQSTLRNMAYQSGPENAVLGERLAAKDARHRKVSQSTPPFSSDSLR